MEVLENNEIDRLFAEQVDAQAPEPQCHFFCRLMEHSRKGHLCLKNSEKIVSERIEEGVDELTFPRAPIIHQKGRYYLQRNWMLETMMIHHLRRLLSTSPFFQVRSETWTADPVLNARQAEAIRHAMEHSLTVVTGGPGTGKTFTAGHIIQALTQTSSSPLCIKIAAPTGKAADRLAQSLPSHNRLDIESMTLHRLLSIRPGRNRLFENRPIRADLIVVDEASMIDASLFAHLLAAIPDGARLILLGDADQLPPIDGGGIYADLAEMIAIHLDRCHRTNDQHMQEIYEAAKNGNVNPLYTILEPLPQNVMEWIDSLFGSLTFDERPLPADLLKRLDRMRWICPLRKGPFGVDAMNAAILQRQTQKLSFGQWWAAPIILTDNDPSLQLYNGSPGIVMGQYRGGSIPYGDEEVILNDGRSLNLSRLPGYEIAFILSVHKSQGSEYDEVYCSLPPGSEEFAREALYTAITRAKRSIRLFGEKKILDAMIATRSRQDNGLRERMAF